MVSGRDGLLSSPCAGISELEPTAEGLSRVSLSRTYTHTNTHKSTRSHYLCEYPPYSVFFEPLPLVSQRGDDVAEGSPLNQLHDDIKMAALFETLVIEHHIGMMELRVV